jgi:dTDP-4-dehydrorhamnose reductase
MSPRVLVLGHHGMLGRVVARVCRDRVFDVATVDARYDPTAPDRFMASVQRARANVVVNALGLVKQRSADREALFAHNAEFPLLLRRALPPDVLLVHASTDCVFSGDAAPYAVGASPDATDAYGASKAGGEAVAGFANTVVVRTSIVGLEAPGRANGLLGWFLSQPDQARVPGYVNHIWNGITTLEWARLAAGFVDGSRPRHPIVQPAVERPWTKADLLRLFATTYRRSIEVVDVEHGAAVDRRLIPTVTCPPLDAQMRDLAAWCTDFTPG